MVAGIPLIPRKRALWRAAAKRSAAEVEAMGIQTGQAVGHAAWPGLRT